MVRCAIHDDTGKVTGFRGTVQDITERKETEQRQQHTNRVLGSIAKDVPLSDTLILLIEQAEAAQQDRPGAILTVDPVSGQIQCGAAPSLPSSFSTTIKIDAPQALDKDHIISDISNHDD
ncbi:MAG: hypothetical protein KUG81_01065 [Gammaproteobacteria bacterium]|nr:hypothetical protein [Gammaproteobacteria bacterium]